MAWRILALLAIALAPFAAHSESSKLVKVDLDVNSTVMVRAELGQGDWYYWVDATACICWVGRKDAATGGMSSTFDCKRLKDHPKMAEHVTKCGDGAPVATRALSGEKESAEAEKPATEKTEKTETAKKE